MDYRAAGWETEMVLCVHAGTVCTCAVFEFVEIFGG